METLVLKTLEIGQSYTAAGVTRVIVDRVGGVVFGARKPNPTVGRGTYHDCEIMEVQRYAKDVKWPNGDVTPAGTEHLPSSSTWGRKAFSLFKYSNARVIFDVMTKDESGRNFREKYEAAKANI